MRSEIGRRRFLKQASLSMLALQTATIARDRHSLGMRASADEALPIQDELLNLVNKERADAGLGTLKLDDLACTVAEKHAIEMAEGNFLSHWGRDGHKPYQRYSFAGGTDAIEENDGATDHGDPVASEEFTSDLIGLHQSMFDEFPPIDGHRQTILAPQHTHAGFGVALRGNHVRLSELYLARYVAFDKYSARGAPKSKFFLSGRLLDPAYSLTSIDVFYETLPFPPELPWLKTPRPYGLPDDRETLLIKLPENTFYETGSRGSIQIHSHGRFRVPIGLTRKQPGIYTVVVWIQKWGMGKPFPATQVCVRAE